MKDMKEKIISGVALLLVAVITAGVIVACTPPKLKYQVTDYGTPVVMTVDGDQIHANEYATYLLAAKSRIESQYASYGLPTDSIWKDETAQKELKTQTEEMLTEYHVFLHKFNELGLQFTKTDLKELNDNNQSLITQYGGEDQLKQQLEKLGYTEEMYNNFMKVSMYVKRLNDYYFGKFGVDNASESDILKKFSKDYVGAKHVLISTVDSTTGKALTGTQLTEKEKLAQEVLKKAQSGEDFDALIKQYGEDPGMKTNAKGYIFKEGEMVSEFYDAAVALKDNEISGLVKSQFGYHIIKRMPLDASRLDDTASDGSSTYRSLISQELTGKNLGTVVEEWTKAAKVNKVDSEIQKITTNTALEIAMTGNKTAAAAATQSSTASSSTAGTQSASTENKAS